MAAGSSGLQTRGDGDHLTKISGVTIVDGLQTDDANFIYEEDKELMLLRVCANLRVGSPAFILRRANNALGNVCFCYSVFMPNCARFMSVHAEGPVCDEDRDARKQASAIMLNKILAITGYEILDFNYRKMLRMQQQLQEEKNKVVESLSKRVRKLEQENGELQECMEMFNKMLKD